MTTTENQAAPDDLKALVGDYVATFADYLSGIEKLDSLRALSNAASDLSRQYSELSKAKPFDNYLRARCERQHAALNRILDQSNRELERMAAVDKTLTALFRQLLASPDFERFYEWDATVANYGTTVETKDGSYLLAFRTIAERPIPEADPLSVKTSLPTIPLALLH